MNTKSRVRTRLKSVVVKVGIGVVLVFLALLAVRLATGQGLGLWHEGICTLLAAVMLALRVELGPAGNAPVGHTLSRGNLRLLALLTWHWLQLLDQRRNSVNCRFSA